ncbi:MAG TPA: aspartate kinase, partial [Flavobacteriaceae bacterium]|nr:aspartate kinase [Flavobacteriaceae bacterium]
MKIFKFGGASVKDAEGVKNVVNVLQSQGYKNTLVVISAMGKMTNAFENIINAYYNKEETLSKNIQFVRDFHYNILNQLFKSNDEIFTEVELLLGKMAGFLAKNKSKNYNYIYDQIIGFGELLSTKIVSHYLTQQNIENTWLDVRNFIKTDSYYRDANVNWEKTKKSIEKIDKNKLKITQGFLGSDKLGKTTSLGREGSDYTAAIFAYCLNASSVTIWKDVDGVLNADPRSFKNTKLLTQISYDEAIEMAFYGASVIHPKTLKPLENKNIPLHVRSFLNLNTEGTKVYKGTDIIPEIPCYILKKEQILVAISALDFSFMVEDNISDIFKVLSNHKLKVNLIQNSALSFSVCVEDKYHLIDEFLEKIKTKYKVSV